MLTAYGKTFNGLASFGMEHLSDDSSGPTIQLSGNVTALAVASYDQSQARPADRIDVGFVEFNAPVAVPVTTRWGMLALILLLVTSLIVAMFRRRAVGDLGRPT